MILILHITKTFFILDLNNVSTQFAKQSVSSEMDFQKAAMDDGMMSPSVRRVLRIVGRRNAERRAYNTS
jgi:hypothetical protein